MAALVDPDNAVKRAIDRRARQVSGRRRRRRYTAAAYETARVEANFTNPRGGDADSGGWRQERRSIYGSDVTNLGASVDRFFNELAQHDRGQPSYRLAADVQRPAARYRDRYRQVHGEALQLLGQLGGSSQASGTRPSSTPRSRTVTTTRDVENFDQAGYDQAVRRQKIAEFLQQHGNAGSVLFRSGLLSTAAVDPQTFTSTSTETTTRRVPLSSSGGSPAVNETHAPSTDQIRTALKAAANRFGITEDSGTNNRSRDVDAMERSFGMVGQPWCGIYLGTVLRRAGVNVDSRVASVSEIEAMARNRTGGFEGGFHSAAHARAGDAVITRQGQHVAFVERVDRDGTLHVIGGNQGTGAVTRTTWKPGQVYGIARPGYRRR